jgi:ATP phosphoribosyltransferase regulatory subunit
VIGLGDADLHRQLLTELGVEGEARRSILERLAKHDVVGLEDELSRAGIEDRDVTTCVTLSQLRGGSEVLDEARALGGPAVERATQRIGETYDALEQRGAAGRVQIDLGLLRDLGYYSGAILEVYDPALGHVLGGGGRYDGLLKRFGVDLPAAGFALYVERVHVAQLEGESPEGPGS